MAPLLASLSTNPKLIKNLLIAFAVIIVGFIAYRKFGSIKATIQSKKLIKESENEIIENAATFTASDYKAMADKLYRAMDGAGTDDEAILQTVSSLRTKTDWLKLVEAFGVKESSAWYSSFTGNLVEWLTDELGGDDRQKVNFSLSRFGISI
jgi:hypothetical protein